MNQQQLMQHTMSKFPKYLAKRYTLGKMIRRNNLRQGQKVVAVIKDAKQSFFFICEILGFASFYDLDGDVCLSENIILNTPENQPFYQGIGHPILKGMKRVVQSLYSSIVARENLQIQISGDLFVYTKKRCLRLA